VPEITIQTNYQTKCNYPYHRPATNHATLRPGRQFKHI